MTQRDKTKEELQDEIKLLQKRITELVASDSRCKEEDGIRTRLMALVDKAPDFIGFASGSITYASYINPAGRRMIGIGEDEDISGFKISDLHPDWANKLIRDEIIPAAIRDGYWTGECAFLHRDGREIPVAMVLIAHKSPDNEVKQFSTISRDITERKRMDEALLLQQRLLEQHLKDEAKEHLESEKKYKLLFENSRDAMMTLEPPDWLFTSGNKALLQMFKIKDETEFIPHYPWTLSPDQQPDGRSSREKAREKIETAMREGSNFFEWTHKRIDGEVFPAEVLLTRVERNGKFLLQATVRDISARKKAEESILSSFKNWQDTFDAVNDVIWLLDNEGRILRSNKATQSIFNLNSEEVLGRYCYGVVHGTDKPYENCPISRMRNSRQRESAELFSRDTWFLITVDPIFDINGSLKGCVHIISNITERKNVDKERLRRGVELQGILDTTASGILAVDNNGKVIMSNKKFSDMWRIPEDILHTGDDATLLKYCMGQLCEPDKFIDKVYSLYNSQEACKDTLIFKDGRFFERESIPLIMNDSLAGRVWSFHDITEIKKAADVIKTAAELRLKFASMVSHELRTPMAIIKEGVSLILEGLVGDVTDKQKNVLNAVKNNADRLARLVNNVLDYQKVQQGKMEYCMEKNNINKVVREVCEIMTILSGEKSVKLIVNTDEHIPVILFDRDRIVQVLTNIIGNAIKYTVEGSITIITEQRDGMVYVTVRDTGPGIDRKEQKKLFQSFVQLDSISMIKAGGTGLGLAISKEIITAHNGTIGVESEIGNGAAFYFALPVH